MYELGDKQRSQNNANWILNEKYTGPIDWPANRREQVLGEQTATLAGKEAIRIKAGQP